MEQPTLLSDDNVMTSVHIMLRMVEDGRYAAAEALRAELVDLEVTIPPSHIYERAARYALRPTFPGDRLAGFTNWFSLVPDATVKARKFRGLRARVFARAHIPQLDIIMRFGLIAASKGHARSITPDVISTVVRYAEPTVSTQYLASFEKEAMKWKRGAIAGTIGAKRG